MIELAMERESDDEGDALTIRYYDRARETAGDVTDAEFIIDDYNSVIDYCKYNCKPLFHRSWIDLSTGEFSAFWQQAKTDYE
jgi:hypothetical protein